MIKKENFPNAYKEVYVILENMKSEYKNAIPQSFIEMVKTNMNDNYKFELDENIDFEEQKLLKETKTILAYIFLHYWATSEQKEKIEQKYRQDIINIEKSKPKYNPNELFNKNK